MCVRMGNKDSNYIKHKITDVHSGLVPGFSKLLIAPAIELFQGCGFIIKVYLEFLLNKAVSNKIEHYSFKNCLIVL